VSRFDFPAFGLTNSTTPVPSEPVAAAPPSATFDGGYGAPAGDGGYAYKGPSVFDSAPAPAAVDSGYSTYQGGPYAGTARKNVQVARLPDVSSEQGTGGVYGDAGGYDTSASSGGGYETDGDAVIVRPGDSLYKIARDYNVSISELMRANNMASPAVKIGQRITVPAMGVKRAPKRLYKTKPVLAKRAPESSGDFDAGGYDDGGSYTVKSGDSLYGIARRMNVKPDALARANGIGTGSILKPGQVLRVPGGGEAAVADAEPPRKRIAAVSPSTAVDAADSGADETTASDDDGSYAPPTEDVSEEGAGSTDEVAARSTEEDAEPEARTDAQFRWPVKGRIIGKYGEMLDGARNDGVNIAVPLGTEVKAAENGVVAYAGEELKGYGKLVLIRHADNWVSAYAHNDEITVKRGDTVSRGQVIAKAGKSGDVDQPQLHFELRKGSQPMDPLPHMAGG
jgi:murein DD-endopeptidase MepM/ murein hydrolase activator NlpD